MATPSNPSGVALLLRRQELSGKLHVAILNDHEISMICTKCDKDMSNNENRNKRCTGKVGSGRTLRNRRTRRNKRTLRNRR